MDVRLTVRRARTALLTAVLAVLVLAAMTQPSQAPAQAPAAESAPPPRPAPPDYLPATPDDFAVTAREALATAGKVPELAVATRNHGRLTTAIQSNDDGTWQVGYKAGDEEVLQVKLDGDSRAITETLTGYQVAWPMARGYEGQFGHKLNAPWVWIPLAALFLFGLLDRRRPWRIAHLDLLVLLSFGISQIYFNRGEIGVSVPLAYPPLVYLLARMLWIGFRGGDGLRPSIGARKLAIVAVFLIVFRVTLNIADSGVIDVGYAGAVGADRITHGQPIYGEGEFPEDNRFGDTYGPANYYAYVPFELALPWGGSWDELPSSHAAAIAFDLLAVAGLFVFGTRMRPGRAGRDLGTVLAFAWVAYPYTTFALQSNSNDALVAVPVIWALALFARPLARAALLAIAVAAKFAPIVLAPLFATGERGLLERRREGASWLGMLRPVGLFTGAFVLVTAVLLAHPAIDPGLAVFFERTVESQLDRTSPFSLWGQIDGVQWLQTAVLALSALLAALVAFVPRRRTIAQVAALAAAVTIALQLAVDHWFYLYIPWFFGPLLIALACASRPPAAAAPEAA